MLHNPFIIHHESTVTSQGQPKVAATRGMEKGRVGPRGTTTKAGKRREEKGCQPPGGNHRQTLLFGGKGRTPSKKSPK